MNVGDYVKPKHTKMVDAVLRRIIGQHRGVIVRPTTLNKQCFVVRWSINGEKLLGGNWHVANLLPLTALEALAMAAE